MKRHYQKLIIFLTVVLFIMLLCHNCIENQKIQEHHDKLMYDPVDDKDRWVRQDD